MSYGSIRKEGHIPIFIILVQFVQVDLGVALGKLAVRHEHETLILQGDGLGLAQQVLHVLVLDGRCRHAKHMLVVMHQVERWVEIEVFDLG